MAAGTLLEEFPTLHAPSALTCSNCCIADTSGKAPSNSVVHCTSALARSDTRPTPGLEEQTHEGTAACSIHALKPFPGFPIGDKRASSAPTVSAPNRLKRDNCCSARTLPAPVLTPPWWRLKIGCPVMYSKTQCYIPKH